MLKRLAVLVVVVTVGGQMSGSRAQGTEGAGLTVHEWGTFTSIAGADGQAVEWRPLSGPSDLPCFVSILNRNNIKTTAVNGVPGVSATVRMETPVLYFYSPREQTIRASVQFPHGVISEWYPQAIVPPVAPVPTMFNASGSIVWNDVKVSPAATAHLLTDPDGSHYYAARETDAAPVQVGEQQEKFLFYRGLGSFQVPIAARMNRAGNVDVSQARDGIDTMILFERRGKNVGYRTIHTDGRHVTIERPQLTATVDSLRNDLRQLLTAHGLYPREAAAMVETWRDSWFEEGARIFYLLPQSVVDEILPLQVEPKPASVTRVFVGRLEVVTPEIETEVTEAIRNGNQAVLRKYGRFLEPISRVVEARLTATHDEGRIAPALHRVAEAEKRSALCAVNGAASVLSGPAAVPSIR